MPKRSSNPGKKKDLNETAFSIMQQVMGDAPSAIVSVSKKNPAAVALGRLGGVKGGAARAASLTPEQRSNIAKKAAQKRWEK